MFERLEERQVLSAIASPYFPKSQFLFNETGFLSEPSPVNPVDVALSYVISSAPQLGLTESDVEQPFVTDFYTDTDTGLSHVYLRQKVNGLEVATADLSVTVSSNGQVLSVGGGFVPGLKDILGADSAATTPDISALDAVQIAAEHLDLSLINEPAVIRDDGGVSQATRISAPDVSLDDIPAHLQYVPTPDGRALLAWELILRVPNGDNWFDLSVPATSGGQNSYGEVVALNDWVEHASYNALPTYNGTPVDGGFAVITDPADPLASPFGWHDTNGAIGAEFTDTRGNNVDAHLDRDADNLADASPGRPNGGAALDFSGFTFDPTQQPTVVQNQNVAQVNLFYVNNILHDVHYQYGFTEAAGNFQVNNYGHGGAQNDALQADAQDGSGTNNSNFATPPDGTAPRMQMFLYTFTNPQRDGDLDDGTIIHEYGHGVSNRLTGGPANSNALSALQSGGMGEGWSDWYGLMFLQRSTDLPTDGFGHSTYTHGDTRNGPGNRTYRYSYDMTIDPHTFNDYGAVSTEVHYAGEIWASALWDMNWNLVNKYGFDSNLSTGWTAAPGSGHAGNKLALRLVMDAMKIQPANPSFIDARNAIIAADNALDGGADLAEIWSAFARRGLGRDASTASSSATSVTTSFVVPPEVLNLVATPTSPAENSVVSTVPVDYTIHFSASVLASSVDASDFAVDGIQPDSFIINPATDVTFHYNAPPFPAQGPHQITLPEGSILQASDGKPLKAYSGTFYYDLVPLQVASTTPSSVNGRFTLPGPFTYEVDFNESIDPSSVRASDLTLLGISGASVSGVSVLPGNTALQFTITGVNGEGILNASLAAGVISDAFGSPNAAFSANYQLDLVSTAYPTPLLPQKPLGSLVYDPTVAGLVGFAGDTDTYTLSLDPFQTVTVLAVPTSGALQPTIELRDQSNTIIANATATAAGNKVLLQTVQTTTSGTYSVTVSGGGTTGSYTMQVILNATLELETNDGPDNSLVAQDISGNFSNLSGSSDRGAVIGGIGTGDTRDLYSFHLDAGDTATVAVQSLGGGIVDLRLLNSAPTAVTRVWDGGSAANGNWMTAENWVGDEAPLPGDDLLFPAGAARLAAVNNFPAGTDFHSITISGSGYTLSSNSILLDAGLVSTNVTGNNTVSMPVTLTAGQTIGATYVSTILTLSGAVNTNGQTLNADGSGTTTLAGVVSGSGAIVKSGPGQLTLNAANTYTGLTTINSGIISANNAASLGSTSAGTVVNAGGNLTVAIASPAAEPLTISGSGFNNDLLIAAGALQMQGATSINWSGPITLANDAAIGVPTGFTFTESGTVTLNGHALTVNSTGTTNFTSGLSDGSGPGSLIVNGTLTTGTVNLTGSSTYTGSTTVRAGVLALSGSGTLLSSSSFVVDQTATLRIDNTATNVANRLFDSAAIMLNGGSLSYLGITGAASTETVGSITLGRGQSTINVTPGASGSTVLTAAGLVRNTTAAANFSGTNLGTATNKLIFTAAPSTVGNSGGILQYATVNAADFATVGANGIAPFTAYVSNPTTAVAGDVLRLTANTTFAATTPAAGSLAGMLLNGIATLTINTGVTLHTSAMLTAGAQSPAIQGSGILDLSGEGFVHTNSASLTLNSVLAAGDAMVLSGTGTFTVGAGQTTGGGTTLNSGTLTATLTGTNVLGTGPLRLVGGTLSPSSLMTIAAPATVIMNSANTTLGGTGGITISGGVTLNGTNTITTSNSSGVTISGSISGTGSLQKLGTNTLTLSPTSPSTYSGGTVVQAGSLVIGTNNSALGSGTLTLVFPTISTTVAGGLTLSNPVSLTNSSVTFIGTQPLTFSGPVSLTAINQLTMSNSATTTFSGPISGSGGLTKMSGTTLVLSGANTYAGATTVNGLGGALRITGSNTASPVGVVSGTLAGDGPLGAISAGANAGASPGTDSPDDIAAPNAVQQVTSANFSMGGNLTMQIGGYGTAGVNYDRLNVSGALTLGGTSTLTLDLAGLSTTGTASGVVLFGSRTGNVPLFSQVAVVNNPNNFGVNLTYNANSIDVAVIPGGTVVSPAGTTDVWTGAGGDNNWSTGSNWASGVAPAANHDLIFPPGAARLTNANNLLAGTSFHSITFAGSGYSISGNSVTLQAGITTTNVSGSNSLSIPLTISGPQKFTSTFGTTTLTVSGTLNTNGQALTIDGTGNTTISGIVSGSGALVKNGPGTFLVNNSNTYTGLTTVNAGIMQAGAINALGSTAAGTIVNSGATLQVTIGATIAAEPLTINGSGVNNNPLIAAGALTNNVSATWSGPITLGSDAAIGVVTATFTISGVVTLGSRTLTVNSASTALFSNTVGAVGDTGSLLVNGTLTTGTVNLTAINNYTGSTNVHAGTLTLSGAGAIIPSSSLAVDQNATLRLDDTSDNPANINRVSDTAPISLRGGNIAYIGSNTANQTSSEIFGAITLVGGHSTISSTVGTGLNDATALFVQGFSSTNGATVNFSGTNLGTASNRINLAPPPTLVGNGGGILPYATVNNNDFATYGINGIAAFTGYVSNPATAVNGDVLRLTGSTTLAANTPASGALAGVLISGVPSLSLNSGVTLHTGSLLATGTAATSISGGTLDLAGTAVTPGQGIVINNIGSGLSLTLSSPLAATDLLVNSGPGNTVLPAPNSNTGGATLNSGTLTVVSGALGTGTLSVVGGTLATSAAATLSNPVAFNSAIATLSGVGSLTLSGTATLTGTSALTFSVASTLSGKITGSGGWQKLGASPLTLSPTSASDYTGGTVLQSSTLLIGTANSALGSGTVQLAGGAIQIGLSGGVTLANPVVINSASFSTVGSQSLTFSGPVTLTGTNTLTMSNTGTNMISGPIGGSGALNQAGANTLVLSGSNSFSGATTVNGSGATLRISNANPNSPVGVLLGTVIGAGAMSVVTASQNVGSVSGTVNLGASAGTLQVPSANFASGGNLVLQIGGYDTAGTNYDQLNVIGPLVLGGSSVLTIDLAGLAATGTALGVIQFGSRGGITPLFSQVSVINNPNNFGAQLTYNANSIDVTIVPGGSITSVSQSSALARGASDAINLDEVINNFRAPTSGTYYVSVTGATGATYNLVVTRNADFDTEQNDSFATAQNLDGAQGVLGYAAPSGFGRVFTFDNTAIQIRELDPITGLILHSFPSPVSSSPGPDFGMANAGATLLVGGSATVPIYELDPDTGAIVRTIPNPGIAVSGMAFLNDEIFVLTDAVAGQITVLDYATGAVNRTIVATPNSVNEGLAASQFGLYGINAAATLVQIDPLTGATVSRGALSGASTIEGLGVNGGELFASDFNVIRVYDLATLAPLRTLSGFNDLEAVGADGGPGDDWYSFSANINDQLILQSQTPGDGPGEFSNTLNPKLELYDPSGALVASGLDLGDGRNEQILHTALQSGLYRLHITSEDGTRGEYFVSIAGNTGASTPFQVTSTSPASGSILVASPTTYTIDFNDEYLTTSAQATDFLIDGAATPAAITLVDGNTINLTLPSLGAGLHTVAIAPGALQDVQGTPIATFTGTFTVDSTSAPRVIATSVAPDASSLPGSLSYQVTFNKTMKASNLTADDFTLHGNLAQAPGVNYTPSSFFFDATSTVLTLNYIGLPEDSYTLTLASGLSGGANFTDAAGNALDGEFAGVFPSGDGFAGGDFVVGFQLDITTAAYPTPLAPKLPLGSLVYDPSVSGAISFAGDTDSYTIALDAGQTISVLVNPTTAALQPSVVVRDASNAVLATGTAPAAGQPVLLNTVAAALGGTYTITISGASSTTGRYTAQLTLNAALESEANGGAANETLATAQNLDESGLSLGGTASRLAVLGSSKITASSTVLFGENFESGVIPPSISTFSSNSFGRIRVTAPGSTGNSSAFALLMDSNTDNNAVLNEAIYMVDLSGLLPTLSFSHFNSADEADALPADFTGHFNGDGVAISDDGNRWHTVLSAPTNSTWTTTTVDLVAAAKAAGMTLGPNFKIKFQQYDNFTYPTDGRGYDNIQILADIDTYKFTLAAGQTATLAATALGTDNTTLELLDSADTPLATGVSGAENLSKVISNFVAPADGIYYARISGANNTQYSVVVTRDAALDTEPNNTIDTAHDFTASDAALGALTAGAGGTSVVPAAMATAETNNQNGFPFNLAPPGVAAGMRYQQIYSHTDFATGGVIDALRFRRSASQAPFTSTPIDVKITLGYAARNVATASSVFADNIGPGAVTVFDGLLTLSSTSPATSPQSFDIVIDVANLFDYVPANGDLLLDVTVRNSPTVGFIAASPLGSQSATTRVYASSSAAATSGVVGFSTSDSRPYGLIADFDMLPSTDEDWYSFAVTDTTSIHLQTATPADGPNQHANLLNPQLELYDPSGALVASGTILGDGRNESIDYLASAVGSYRVRLVSTDTTSGEYVLSKSVTHQNFSPTITSLTVDSPINENDFATLHGTISDPDVVDPHSAVINWGDGSSTTLHLAAGELTFTTTHQYLDDGSSPGNGTGSDTYIIGVGMTDDDGAIASASTSVTVNNVGPSDISLNSGSINETDTFTLTGSFSDPGTQDTHTVIINWGPGEGSTTLNLTAGVLSFSAPHQYLDDNPSGTASDVYPISVTVTDDDTRSDSASAQVTVHNLAPIATVNAYFTAQAIAITGNVVTDNTGSGTDSDPAGPVHDPLSISGFTQPPNGTLSLAPDGTFVYTPDTTFSGTDSFTYTITDGDLGYATATVTIIVSAAAPGSILTIPDSCLGGTALLVTGTLASDTIIVEPGSNSATLKVTINGVSTTVARPSGRIIVTGGDGDDNIQIAGAVMNPAWLYGEAGNDRLNAGNGGSLLIGGDGNDQLLGGGGRDVMIGGKGADSLVGNSEDDILIAGYTDEDSRASAGHDDFWCQVLHEWNSSDSFAQRVQALHPLLCPLAHGDHFADVVDFLNGAAGNDWLIFISGEDNVAGQAEATN